MAISEITEPSDSGQLNPRYLTRIRDWVASWTHLVVDPRPRKRTDFLSPREGSLVHKVLIPQDYWRWPLQDIYQYLSTYRGGVLCGGAAWALMRVYDYLGLEAYTFNVGRPPESFISHVVVLVRSPTRHWYLQDPSTGLTVELGITVRDWEASFSNWMNGCSDVANLSSKVRKSLILPVNSINEVSAGAYLIPPEPYRNPKSFRAIKDGVSLYNNVSVTWKSLGSHPWWPEAANFLSNSGVQNPHPGHLFLYPLGISSVNYGWTGTKGQHQAGRQSCLLNALILITSRMRHRIAEASFKDE